MTTAPASPLPSRPTARALVVPVRDLSCGACTLSTARLPDGGCTGLAFTSVDRLHAALGEDCHYELLSPGVVWSMLHERGIDHLRIDPDVVDRPGLRPRVAA